MHFKIMSIVCILVGSLGKVEEITWDHKIWIIHCMFIKRISLGVAWFMKKDPWMGWIVSTEAKNCIH